MNALGFRILLIISTIFINPSYGQNLVPNGDFEAYNACPTTISGIGYSPGYTFFPTVKDWASPLSLPTPDYFNSCAPFWAWTADVPDNLMGHQTARSGNGYAGIYTVSGTSPSSSADYREYVTVKLTSPLKKDHSYCVRFYVSTATMFNSQWTSVAANDIGAHFSAVMPKTGTALYLTVPYHVMNDTARHLTDTMKWQEISGIYTAAGGETWMTIGCFVRGSRQLYSPLVPGSTIDSEKLIRGYAYIDDVSVTPAPVKSQRRDLTVCVPPDSLIKLTAFTGTTVSDRKIKWNTGDTGTTSIAVSASGSYWCMAVKDCSVYIDTFHVRFRKDTIRRKVDTVICTARGDSAFLNFSASAQVTGRIILWSTGDTGSRISVRASGVYWCTSMRDCYFYTDTFHVKFANDTLYQVYDTSICQFTLLPRLPMPEGTEYLWYIDGRPAAPSLTQPEIITNKAGGIRLVLWTRVSPCKVLRTIFNVRIIRKPIARKPLLVERCIEDLHPPMIGTPPETGETYLWDNETHETTCCIAAVKDGRYIRLTSSICGSAADTFDVKTEVCENCIIFPSAFSPDGNGLNDQFRPIVRCPIENFKLRIFNRWGECVFVSFNSAMGWDGLFHGQPAAIGTYSYLAICTHSTTGKEFLVKGNFTLLR